MFTRPKHYGQKRVPWRRKKYAAKNMALSGCLFVM